jgi:DNA-binding NarL/FixJ family response regulator
MSIRIVVVASQRLFRASFRALLCTQPDFQVVGEAGERAAAISIAAASSPDIALIEASFAGGADLSLVGDLAALPSAPRIIAILGPGICASGEALAGIVSKDDPADEVFAAIRAIAGGQTHMTSRLAPAVPQQHNGERPAFLRKLTSREHEVLKLVLQGDTTAGIAKKLSVSPRTVETHRSHVMHKLSVRSTVDVVRLAARNGLLSS